MDTLGNRIENWDRSYEDLPTTYSEKIDTPAHLSMNVQFEFVYRDIQRYLNNTEKARVLECGCGGARTALYLALRGIDVTCSDFASEALRLAKQNFSVFNAQGTFLQDDLLNTLLPRESFDCVMSFGLLEHFEDLQPIIKNMTGLLKTGGIHIHTIIPKKFSTQTIMDSVYFPIRLLRNILVKKDFKDIVRKSFRDFPHYENSFTASEYSRFFEKEGNTVLKCQAGGILHPFTALPFGLGPQLVKTIPNVLRKLTKFSNSRTSRFFHLISPTFYIVCMKN